MMICYINHSYQLYSFQGPKEKGLKEAECSRRKVSDIINNRRVCSYRATLLSDSCILSEEQVWYVRQYMYD